MLDSRKSVPLRFGVTDRGVIVKERRHAFRTDQSGMSLIEVMIAGFVFVVGCAGVMALIITAVASNGRNKMDTTSVALGQMVMERILTLPEGSTTNTTVTDCAGTIWTIESQSAASPGVGAGLNGGAIDYSQDYNVVPTNYKMQYVVCDASGQQATYDVRWNITNATTHTSYVVLGVRPTGAASGNLRYFALPITMKVLVGQ